MSKSGCDTKISYHTNTTYTIYKVKEYLSECQEFIASGSDLFCGCSPGSDTETNHSGRAYPQVC